MKIKKPISLTAIGAGAMLLISSCGGLNKYEEAEADRKARIINEIELAEMAKRDSLERIYILTLDEIDENLDEIRDNYGYLKLGPNSNAEYSSSKKEQIIGNISMINGLLEENKTKIAELEKSLVNYKSGKAELLKSIALAKKKVEEQESEVAALKAMLAEKDFLIGELNRTVTDNNATIAENTSTINGLVESNNQKEKEINKIYFYCGTYKDLKEKHMIQKKGGVLGLRKTKVLNGELNTRDFVEFDKTTATSFAVAGSKPKLITNHPENSYVIEEGKDKSEMAVLKITDPESFWKVSKYLIVEVQ